MKATLELSQAEIVEAIRKYVGTETEFKAGEVQLDFTPPDNDPRGPSRASVSARVEVTTK